MNNFYQSSDPLKKVWTAIVSATPWTHDITISPQNRYLRTQEEIYRCGLSLAKRIREREHLAKRQVILFPEKAPNDFWHYHGFVVHPNGKEPNFAATGSDYLTSQLKLQAEHKFRGTQFSPTTRPSVLIRPLYEDATRDIHYIMKNWRHQNKVDNVIWF
jgi:hypothetical protein